jgi:UDP-N-acetylmuramate dehydrogenase
VVSADVGGGIGAGVEAVAAAMGERARRDVPLGPLTTYGVGGPAALVVEVEDEGDLEALRTVLAETGTPTLVLGRGSNVLVADAGFDGVVVHLGSGFADIGWPERGGEALEQVVRAGAAVALPVLARRAADAGWSGLSWAVGVPGSVGGAVRMNAGGHGSDMHVCVRRFTWVDLYSDAGGTDDVARLEYGYRRSSVRAHDVVLEAQMVVTPGSAEAEQSAVSQIVRWRRKHQPGGANAGSVFTNPEGDSAGRLIEAAGLKGFRLGTAHVSEKHANFIQADKGGRADDVRALMEHVRSVVEERCGVVLAAEVRLLGFGGWETGAMAMGGRG